MNYSSKINAGVDDEFIEFQIINEDMTAFTEDMQLGYFLSHLLFK